MDRGFANNNKNIQAPDFSAEAEDQKILEIYFYLLKIIWTALNYSVLSSWVRSSKRKMEKKCGYGLKVSGVIKKLLIQQICEKINKSDKNMFFSL